MLRILFPRRLFLSISLLLLLILTTTACGSQPEPTPTPTRTPRPTLTPTSPPPTNTPVPTNTPTPDATDTPAPTPTETPTPEPPTPTPTPTLDPNIIVPENGSGISLFTGQTASDPAVLDRRPLAIKISNDESAHARQAGLNAADVIVESRVEFSYTRFTTIYQSQGAQRVGPVRSARLIDLEIPVIFDAVLAFSGGVRPVRDMIYGSNLGDHVIEQALNGHAYYRDPELSIPNNLFADTTTLWNVVTNRGWNQPPEPTGKFVFSQAAPEGGNDASSVRVPYPILAVNWQYDAASGRWLRSAGGKPHIDLADNQQVSAANVVILSANHVKTLIIEHGEVMRGEGQACINCSVEVQLWGEGPLKVLRDGKVYEGKWIRDGRFGDFRFLDGSGQDIPLKPGSSWWQVAPMNMNVTVQ